MNKESFDSPSQQLLHDWAHSRTRLSSRAISSYAPNLRKVVAKLDAHGPSHAGDCIESLLFDLEAARNYITQLRNEIEELESR